MPTTIDDVREAIEFYEAQGKDRLASPRTAQAITQAMVASYLAEHGRGRPSATTLTKLINGLKNGAVAQQRETAQAAPLGEETLTKINAALGEQWRGLAAAIAGLIQEARKEAIEEISQREAVYKEDEAELERTAEVRLAVAGERIAALEAALAEARETAAKATGRAEEIARQMAEAKEAAEARLKDSSARVDTLWKAHEEQRAELRGQTEKVEALTVALGEAKGEAAKLSIAAKGLARVMAERDAARAEAEDLRQKLANGKGKKPGWPAAKGRPNHGA